MFAVLQSALRSVFEQRGRTILSALGVLVGSTAILLLVGIAKGVQADVSREVKDIGVNILIVLPGRVDEGGSFNPNLGGQSYLREADAQRVRKIDGVLRAATLTFTGGGVRSGKEEAYPVTIAATPDWFAMHKSDVAEGVLFTDKDRNQPVCVLGGVAKRALFGEESSLGKKVLINGIEYKVIGATREREQSSGLFSMFGFQNVVYVPYDFVRAKRPDMQIDRIMIQYDVAADPKILRSEVDAALDERLDRQQFSVLTEEDLLGLVYKLMNILTWLVTGLTSIAIFVGGIGILTVMLMAVGERAREIGIRKASGARNDQIFWQFLFESLTISTIGVAGGLIISLIVGWGLNAFTPIKPLFTWDVLLLAFAVSIGVGTVFGLLPAIRASRKDPIVALRYE